MFLTFHEVLPDSVLFVASLKFSFLRCNFFIISHLFNFVKQINCELKFLSVLSNLSLLNISKKCIQSFLSLSHVQASVKFCSLSTSLHPAPCIGVPQLSVSSLHALSSSLTPPFLVRQLYYYIISSPVCQCYLM